MLLSTAPGGKEHWWWDTEQPNDGGSVNDAALRAFFDAALARPPGPRRGPITLFNPASVAWFAPEYKLIDLLWCKIDFQLWVQMVELLIFCIGF